MDPLRRLLLAAIGVEAINITCPWLSFAAEEVHYPELAIVLDDAGNSKASLYGIEKLAKADVPITIAVLPGLPYTNDALDILSTYDNSDIFLHQPMEAKQMYKRGIASGLETHLRKEGDVWNKDKHTAIYHFDSPTVVHETITHNLFRMGGYLDDIQSEKRIVGLNNHMGSLVTENTEICSEIADVCLSYGLILLDSVTTVKSKLYSEGIENSIPAFRRNTSFFPANAKNNANNEDVCYKELVKIAQRANIRAPNITIGHAMYSGCIDGLIDFSKEYSFMLKRMSQLK